MKPTNLGIINTSNTNNGNGNNSNIKDSSNITPMRDKKDID